MQKIFLKNTFNHKFMFLLCKCEDYNAQGPHKIKYFEISGSTVQIPILQNEY